MAFIRVDWAVDADPEHVAALVRRIGKEIEGSKKKKPQESRELS